MLEVITQHMCKSSYFVKEERLHSGHQGSIPTFSPFYTGIRLLSLPHVKQYGLLGCSHAIRAARPSTCEEGPPCLTGRAGTCCFGLPPAFRPFSFIFSPKNHLMFTNKFLITLNHHFKI